MGALNKNIFCLILLLFCINVAYPQNYKKFKRAGISYEWVEKDEYTMASDNEFNRKTICYGYSDDRHYKIVVYYHYGHFYNELWGVIDGCYSINIYSTKIDSRYPIEKTDFKYASFQTNDVIDYCEKYGIKSLSFYN